MKKMIFFPVILSVLLAGCMPSVPVDLTITVSGFLMLPAQAAGKKFVVCFDQDRNPFNGVSKKVEGTCIAGLAVPYEAVLSTARNYYIYAYVENDNAFNAADMKYVSDGDYFGLYGAAYPNWPASANASVQDKKDQVFDINLVSVGDNISGTLSFSASRTQDYYVMIDTDTSQSNGYSAVVKGSAGGSSSAAYSALMVFPGRYYAYAVVDVDMDTLINYDSGDELGYYGSAEPLRPPQAPNLDVPESGNLSGIDISLAQNNGNVSVLLKMPAGAMGKPYRIWFNNSYNMSAGMQAQADFSGFCADNSNEVFVQGNVAQGEYYIYAYVDVSTTGMPNAGDYIGVYGALYPQVMTQKTALPGAFVIDMAEASNNTGGNITGAGSLTFTASAYVGVLTDLYDASAAHSYYMGTASGDFSYSLFVPFSGKYIIVAMISPAGVMNPTAPGNMVGFAGNTGLLPYLPVTTPNIQINSAAYNTVNIPVGEIPINP